MTSRDTVSTVRHYTSATAVPEDLPAKLIRCWVAVTNAGGAAGFPFPPVTTAEVTPALEAIVAELDPQRCRLLVADNADGLLGWAVLRHSADPLIAHCGSLHHVQCHPDRQRNGVGSALVTAALDTARDELRLRQVHLAVRGGMGLEDFYARFGWREIGRWPAALRLGDHDFRDEVLLHLPLR